MAMKYSDPVLQAIHIRNEFGNEFAIWASKKRYELDYDEFWLDVYNFLIGK